MKTLKIKIIFVITISLLSLISRAQIKVASNTLVGIGTTNPNSYFNLHVANGGNQTRLFADGGQDGATYGLGIYSAGSSFNGGYITTNSSHLFKLCILNQGGGGYYVGIGVTSPSCALDVYGVIKMNGSTITSDMRLKDNINNVKGALVNLNKLQGVTYRLKKNSFTKLATSTNTPKTDSSKVEGIETDMFTRDHIGFLAQDVQKIYPELVYSDKEGMLSVDYVSLIPVLVEAVKEISTKRDADNVDNQSQISLLKNKIKTDSINYQAKLKELSDKIDKFIEDQKEKSKQSSNTGAYLNSKSFPTGLSNPFYMLIPDMFMDRSLSACLDNFDYRIANLQTALIRPNEGIEKVTSIFM